MSLRILEPGPSVVPQLEKYSGVLRMSLLEAK